MTIARLNRAPVVALLLLGAGCAHYAEAPLEGAQSALTAPVSKVLAEQASAITRPWLAATPVDLSAPLTPQGVAALAVVNNPDLMALRARAGIADAQAFAAGLLPDPVFSAGAQKVLSGPDNLPSLLGALGFDLGALRTRAVTRERANAEALQVRLDLAWAEWQTAGQARIEAARVVGLGRLVTLSQLSETATRTQQVRLAQAAARGDVSASEAETARIAAFDAGERLRAAQRELLAAQQQLARLLGLPPDTLLALAPVALPEVALPPARLFALATANRTDLAALRAGYVAQEAAVHKAVLDQFPTLGLSINGDRDSTGNFLLGPSISFTLPLWNRNQGGIATGRATREALRLEYDARLFQTRADIAAASAGIDLSRRQLDAAQTGLAGSQTLAAASAQAAARGDLSAATAMTADQALRDRELLVAQSILAIREQTIALELLSGTTREGWK